MIQLNDRFRINDIGDQWLLERRKTPSHPWRTSEWYCRTKDGLLLGIREQCGVVSQEGMAAVNALPNRYQEGVAKAV